MTTFILMRHGEAGAHRLDDQRELTAGGRAEVASTADQLKAAELGITHIWASPYVRAQQTAEICRTTLGFNGDVITCPDITPDNQVSEAAHALRDAPEGVVLVCFHQPIISRLVEWLTDYPVSVPTATAFELHSGSVMPGGYSLGRTFLA